MDEGLVQHKDKDGFKLWLRGILTNDKVLDCRSIKEGRDGGGVMSFTPARLFKDDVKRLCMIISRHDQ